MPKVTSTLYTLGALLLMVVLLVLSLIEVEELQSERIREGDKLLSEWFINTQASLYLRRGNHATQLNEALIQLRQSLPSLKGVYIYVPGYGTQLLWLQSRESLLNSYDSVVGGKAQPILNYDSIFDSSFETTVQRGSFRGGVFRAVYTTVTRGDAYPYFRRALVALLVYALLGVIIFLGFNIREREQSREKGFDPLIDDQPNLGKDTEIETVTEQEVIELPSAIAPQDLEAVEEADHDDSTIATEQYQVSHDQEVSAMDIEKLDDGAASVEPEAVASPQESAEPVQNRVEEVESSAVQEDGQNLRVDQERLAREAAEFTQALSQNQSRAYGNGEEFSLLALSFGPEDRDNSWARMDTVQKYFKPGTRFYRASDFPGFWSILPGQGVESVVEWLKSAKNTLAMDHSIEFYAGVTTLNGRDTSTDTLENEAVYALRKAIRSDERVIGFNPDPIRYIQTTSD